MGTPSPACYRLANQMIDLDRDEANIVHEILCGGELLNVVDQSLAERAGAKADVSTSGLKQSGLLEISSVGALDLEKAVGEKQEGISRAEFAGATMVFGVPKDSQRGVGPRPVEGKRRRGLAIAADTEWDRVAGIRIAEFAPGKIDHEIAGRHKNRHMSVFEDFGNFLIQSMKEICRFASIGARILDERAKNRRDQSRAHSVPHHVGDEHSCHGVGDLKDVKEVSSHS